MAGEKEMATVKILSLNGNHLATAVFTLYQASDTHIAFTFSHQPVNFELGASIRLYDVLSNEIGGVYGEAGDHRVRNKYHVVGRIHGIYAERLVQTEYGPMYTDPVYVYGENGNTGRFSDEGDGVLISMGIARFDTWSGSDEAVFQNAVRQHATKYVESLGGSVNDLEYVVSQYKGYIPTYELQKIAGGAAFLLGCFQPYSKPKGFISRLFGR